MSYFVCIWMNSKNIVGGYNIMKYFDLIYNLSYFIQKMSLWYSESESDAQGMLIMFMRFDIDEAGSKN